MHDRPNYPGGPIVNYLRLLPRFVNLGFEVHLLAFCHEDYPNARSLSAQGVKIHPKRATSLLTQDLTEWILQKIAQIQPDVFIPDVSTPGNFAGKWVRESGIPVINTHRSADETNRGRALYFSDARSPYVSTGIVCVSAYLRDELLSKVDNPALLTKVIPSGVEIPEHVASQGDSCLRVVYAGRLVDKQKRIGDTVQAFIHLCNRLPALQFTLIGDGPERELCQRMISDAGLRNRVSFTGLLLGDDYKMELARHHVIVLLSDYEGLPGSVMDGMSCGLIPVCKEFAGVNELIADGENGFVVVDRDGSFYQVMEQLYRNSELRERMSTRARQQIVDGFSIDIAVARWLAFFDECRAAAGEKRPFRCPRWIRLPGSSPLLPEHNVNPDRPTLLQKLRRRTRLRARLQGFFS